MSGGCPRDLLRSISRILRGESRVPPVLTPRTPKLLELLSRIVRDLRNRTFRGEEEGAGKRIGNGPPKDLRRMIPQEYLRTSRDPDVGCLRFSSVKFIGTREKDRSLGLSFFFSLLQRQENERVGSFLHSSNISQGPIFKTFLTKNRPKRHLFSQLFNLKLWITR